MGKKTGKLDGYGHTCTLGLHAERNDWIIKLSTVGLHILRSILDIL